MSVQAGEGASTEEPRIELPPQGDAAFGALMDALVGDTEGTEGGEATGEAGAAAEAPDAGGADSGGGGDAPAGQQAARDDGAAAAAGDGTGAGATDGTGDEGAAAGGAEQPAAAAGTGDRPADWTARSTDLIPKLGQLSTKIEESTQQAYQNAAFEAVREEHSQYFEALSKHPRLLVGQQVPAIGKDGMETLRDTNDAREWQEAVKSILVEEVNDRAGRDLEENRDFLETVHASIELFQNNADLVPGTQDFDVELANRFATLAKPYELRVEGKLQGYTIPVQPIIDQLRTQVQGERAAKPAAPATTPPAAGAAPAAAKASEPPQAGIPSKAGNSASKEDFSTLFGTIGLPNLNI